MSIEDGWDKAINEAIGIVREEYFKSADSKDSAGVVGTPINMEK